MDAPIIIDDRMDLYEWNKAYFCNIVVKAAAIRGWDISTVFENAQGSRAHIARGPQRGGSCRPSTQCARHGLRQAMLRPQ